MGWQRLDFAAMNRGDYRSASPYLRAEWQFWRDTASHYGFGRTESLPIRCHASSGIYDFAIKGFNHQNAILEFKIEDCGGEPPVGLRVTFVSAHGLSGSFCASGAEVLSVIPCDERGSP